MMEKCLNEKIRPYRHLVAGEVRHVCVMSNAHSVLSVSYCVNDGEQYGICPTLMYIDLQI
jgi:hypothetical protein